MVKKYQNRYAYLFVAGVVFLVGVLYFAKLSLVRRADFRKQQLVEQEQQQLSAEVQSMVDSLDQQLDTFYPVIGFYPPQLESDEDRQQVENQFAEVANQAEDFISEQDNLSDAEAIRLYASLGELYRLGHNLDLEGSWEKSESYFQKALAIDDANFESKNGLATLYVNTGPDFAHQAEVLFLSTLKDPISDDQKVNVYQGLFFAYYYQFDLDKALIAADKGLEIDPTNEQLLTLKQTAEAVKNRK